MDQLTDAEREEFEERAAIMEHDGGLARESAEFEAFNEVMKRRCEARAVARMATDDERREYLANVAKHRGQQAADNLRQSAWAIMREGKHGKA